ncbi:HDOD domain-containing protein [Oxalobacteraceae bacterium]|nr:HDOD domain-containing protein [Oxalobacteraceae bacterium]
MFEWFKRLIIAPLPPESALAGASAMDRAGMSAAPQSEAEHAIAQALAGTNTGASPSFAQKEHVDHVWFRWLFDKAEGSTLQMNRAEGVVLDALAAIVNADQSGSDLVRRMPGLIPQVLQSLRCDRFSGTEIARLISGDLVLVAAVVRLANNARQFGAKEIVSVEHAILVIGQEGLRHLITTVAFRPIIDLQSGYYSRRLAPRIWEQAERCAVASRMLAEQSGGTAFDAFLAGLAQHVGLLVALRLMDQASGGPGLGSSMFCARLQQLARQLSCRISREWNFPPAAVLAIAEQETLHRNARPSDMGRLLAQTDYLSKTCILSEQGLLDEADPALFEGLPATALACYNRLHAFDTATTP